MRRATAPATMAALGAVGWAVPALAPVAAPAAGALGLPRRSVARDTVALTFDDGPHPQGTPAVLEHLAAAGVRATFFMVGEQVDRNPALAAEVAAAGHAIAVHGQRHRLLLRLGPRSVADDLDRAAAAIGPAAGGPLVLHRAPYGIYSWPALGAVRARGWSPVLWSRWGHDWRRGRAPAAIAAEVTEDLRAGDVLLLHDADDYGTAGSWRHTAAALPRVLEAIAERGLGVAPLTGADDLAQPSGR